MNRKIKYIAHAVKWFDRVNGNTYHSVRITRCSDGKVIAAEYQYGYGEHYKQTALEVMAEAKWLPVKYRSRDNQYLYERQNNYPIEWQVSEGRKKDCIANGIIN